jgi:hypothetical protein
MRSVTYSMSVSLDGYIVGPDGGFDWTAPDEEVFRFWTDEIREVGVHLMGRRLYETMLYWETADQDPSLDDAELEWAAIWKPLPKVVFSTTLSEGAGQCPPGLRRPGGGDRAVASRARRGRHRDRRRDSCRRGGRVGSDRRVPGHGPPFPSSAFLNSTISLFAWMTNRGSLRICSCSSEEALSSGANSTMRIRSANCVRNDPSSTPEFCVHQREQVPGHPVVQPS